MSTLHRIVRIIFSPQEEWQTIAQEKTSVDVLVRRWVLPLAFLTPIATWIGMKVFDASWDAEAGYLVPAGDIFSAAATTLFAGIISLLVLAGIFVWVAPMYGGKPDYRTALQVSVYGAIPLLVAGGTLLLPVMVIVGIVGFCHTLYLYWLGAKHVFHLRSDSLAEFVGISLLLLSICSTFIGAAASSIGLF